MIGYTVIIKVQIYQIWKYIIFQNTNIFYNIYILKQIN